MQEVHNVLFFTENQPPIFNMSDSIEVTIGQEVSVEVKARDLEDQGIIFNVTTNINPSEWEFSK